MKYLILTIAILIGFALSGVKCHGSELSDLADSLQPGEWGLLETTGWGPALYNDGGYPATAWINTAGYYNGRVLINGRAHNFSTPHLYVYDELTNTWTEGTSPGSRAHGYDHNVVDPNTGDFYTNRSSQIFSVLRDGQTTWQDLPTTGNDPYFSNGMAVAYHPIWNKLVYGSRGRINGFDGTSWSAIISSGLPYALDHQIAEYNPKDSCIYMGGGNGNNVLAKIELDESFTLLPASVSPIGPDMGNFVFGPTTGNGYLIDPDGDVNCLFLGDTVWSNACDVVPWGVSNGNNFVYGVVAIPVPTYGAIMYATLNEIWVYKDGQPDTTTVPPIPPDTTCLTDTVEVVLTDTLFQTDTLLQIDSVPVPFFTWPDSIWMDSTLYLKQ